MKPTPTWRDVLPIHPAAELFPLMPPDELRALGEDIKKNGLRVPAVLFEDQNGDVSLLDGRNRLDALELIGEEITPDNSTIFERIPSDLDRNPYEIVVSLNIHRRHLTAEQKRGLIAKLLKATPEKSDRQIAETVRVSHHTVGAVRTESQSRGQIAHAETRTDTRGRQQPASKDKRTVPGAGVGMHRYTERGLDLYETPPVAVRNATDVRLALIDRGYVPVPLYGKKPLLETWSRLANVNRAQIETWAKSWPDASNTGALTALMPTLDLDVLNLEAVEAVVLHARDRFEERRYVPARTGKVRKTALVFRVRSMMTWRGQPSPKQLNWLTSIYERMREAA